MKTSRLVLLLACLVGLVVVGGLAWRAGVFRGEPASQGAVGGAFQLVNQDGKPVDESVLKGKWSVVFFGFTYCPDVCPGTMQALAQASQQLGPRAKDLQIVFISVDPERDTPAQVKEWLTAQGLPAGTMGLTGSPAQVAAAAKVYRVYYQKKGEGPGYTVDHSTPAYLMNPKGGFRAVLPYGLTPEQMADQIRTAMRD